MMAPMKLTESVVIGEFALCITQYVIFEEGSRGCNISMCNEGSGRLEVNQWHQGLGDGRINEMDMSGWCWARVRA
jgi:hypothetical protein